MTLSNALSLKFEVKIFALRILRKVAVLLDVLSSIFSSLSSSGNSSAISLRLAICSGQKGGEQNVALDPLEHFPSILAVRRQALSLHLTVDPL